MCHSQAKNGSCGPKLITSIESYQQLQGITNSLSNKEKLYCTSQPCLFVAVVSYFSDILWIVILSPLWKFCK